MSSAAGGTGDGGGGGARRRRPPPEPQRQVEEEEEEEEEEEDYPDYRESFQRFGTRVGAGGDSGGTVGGLNLTKDEVKTAYNAFKRFDKDGSGAIDTKELTALLRSMGQNPTDSEVHDMINEVDVDGSGVVEFEEFVQFIARLMRNSDPENEVRECYRRFDPENEGAIHTDELRFVMSNLPVKLSDKEVDELIQAADTNSDGKISFEEFKRMMGH